MQKQFEKHYRIKYKTYIQQLTNKTRQSFNTKNKGIELYSRRLG